MPIFVIDEDVIESDAKAEREFGLTDRLLRLGLQVWTGVGFRIFVVVVGLLWMFGRFVLLGSAGE